MDPITINAGSVITLSKFAASYLGLIEDSSLGIDKLVHAPMQCAKSCLEDAVRSTDNVQRFQYLLQEAERNFRNAVPLEECEAKVYALLGLSLCQVLLSDRTNAANNFKKMTDVTLPEPESKRLLYKGFARATFNALNPFMPKYKDQFNDDLTQKYEVRARTLEFHKKLSIGFMRAMLEFLKQHPIKDLPFANFDDFNFRWSVAKYAEEAGLSQTLFGFTK